MHKKRLQWWICAALVVMLAALTGCQAVQGLDFGQALTNNISIKSSEAKGTLGLELTIGDASNASPQDKALNDALKNTKLTIKSAKMQDKEHASIDGELSISRGVIPFQAVVDGPKVTIQIEGGKKPIVFDQSTISSNGQTTTLSKELQEKIRKSAEELRPALIKFFLTNAPNPKKVTVSNVSEQVNNETLNLQQAHVELTGSELIGLLKAFLSNVLADEQGLKDLLGQIYDVAVPIIKEQMKASEEKMKQDFPELESPDNEMPNLALAYLDNKTLAVEFAYTTIHEFLKKAVTDFDATIKDNISSEKASAQIHDLFSDKLSFKADYLIDQDKLIRKQKFELTIPNAEPDDGVSQIKLSGAFEYWNLNKPVTADTIDTTGGALNVDAEKATGLSLLNNFDKNSLFYKLLKDDLKVTYKQLHLVVEDEQTADEDLYGFAQTQPYINSDNVTMVPVRFLSEQFGAEVKWNGELQQITINDTLSGKSIVMALNSKTATVDGQSIELESAPTLKNGSSYVPIRFIAEKLGAKVEFDDETQLVTITRE